MPDREHAKPTLMDRFPAALRAPAARLALREIGAIALVFVGAALLLLSFAVLAEEVVEGDTHRLDLWLMSLFTEAGNPADRIGPDWFEEMVRDVTALGSYAFIIVTVVIVGGYLLLVRKLDLAALMVGAIAGGMAISHLLKELFDRPRPDIDHAVRVFTASFPSGHATLSAVTFLTLAALLTRTRARRGVKIYFVAVAVVLTILTGLSRVYLGVHYPSDVLAGWCVGAGWAILCWAAALVFSGEIGSEPERNERGYAIMNHDDSELFDEATKVTAKDDEVILDGPDGIDVKLTPEAARETSNRLWDGAAKAKGQRTARKRRQ